MSWQPNCTIVTWLNRKMMMMMMMMMMMIIIMMIMMIMMIITIIINNENDEDDDDGADRTQVGPMLAPWTLLSGSTLEESVMQPDNGQHWKAFSWNTLFIFWINFRWSLFLGMTLTVSQHWFTLHYWLPEPTINLKVSLWGVAMRARLPPWGKAWMYIS